MLHNTHDSHGPELDLTFGRIGNHRSGFLHIGGTPGDLHLSASLYRHPGYYGYDDHHGYYDHNYYGNSYYGHTDTYPYRYGSSHYYYDYRAVGYHDYRYRRPYYGYNYSCAYYDEPVYYELATPTVVYVQPETVYIEREPETVTVYTDQTQYASQPTATAQPYVAPPVVAAPVQTAPVEPAPEAGPYQPIGDSAKTVIQEGTAAFAAGQFDKARRLFIEAVMADERDGYAKMLYGFAAFASGDYTLAGISLRRALRTSEGLIVRPLDVRTLYPDQAVFEAQRHALQAYVTGHPEDRGARFVLGYVYYATARPELAAERFGELAASDKDDDLAKRLFETAQSVERIEPK